MFSGGLVFLGDHKGCFGNRFVNVPANQVFFGQDVAILVNVVCFGSSQPVYR